MHINLESKTLMKAFNNSHPTTVNRADTDLSALPVEEFSMPDMRKLNISDKPKFRPAE